MAIDRYKSGFNAVMVGIGMTLASSIGIISGTGLELYHFLQDSKTPLMERELQKSDSRITSFQDKRALNYLSQEPLNYTLVGGLVLMNIGVGLIRPRKPRPRELEQTQ